MKRLLLSLLALIVPVAFADDVLKLGTVYDLPVMYLSSPITSTTQVEPEITIAAPIRNGSALIIPSLSGAVFEIAFGGYTESVYASRVAVNATTGVITLTGSVVRDLCYNQATAFTSCNNGRRWGKGAQVRLVDTAKRFNRLADRTWSNVFNASGAIKFSGSGTIELPSYTSATERTQQSPTPNLYSISCLDSTGKCSIYAGGQWTEIATATGSFVNASETVAGKGELGIPSDLSGSVLLGDSGAPILLWSGLTIRHSSGAINNRNKIVATNNMGYLSGSLLGSGDANGSGILLGNQTYLSGSASGQFLRLNSQVQPQYVSYTPPVNDRTLSFDATSTTSTGASTTANFYVPTHQYTIPANSLVSGVGYEYEYVCQFSLNNTGGADQLNLALQIGGSDFSSTAITLESNNVEFLLKGTVFGTASAGASVAVKNVSEFVYMTGTQVARMDYASANAATNGNLTLRIRGDFDTSDANNGVICYASRFRKISTTSF